jgi:hypothetical protein
MKETSSVNTVRIAVSGVVLAINVVLLWFASFVPSVEMTLMALCGATVYLVSRMYRPVVGLLIFTASVILAVLIVPTKIAIIPYFFLFGPYAVIKPLIDDIAARLGGEPTGAQLLRRRSKRELIIGYAIKSAVFIVLLGLAYFIFNEAFFAGIRLPAFIADSLLPLLTIVASGIFFYIFDYVLGLLYTILYRYVPKNIIPKQKGDKKSASSEE